MSTNSQVPATQSPLTIAQRFTQSVVSMYEKQANSTVKVSDQTRLLINSYFVKIESMLKDAETKRLSKKDANKEIQVYVWKNVDMDKLAKDVFAYSLQLMDPSMPNQLNCIPYQNNNTGKIDITFMPGYRGIEFRAKMYGLEGSTPDYAVIKLVFQNEKFVPIYKDANNQHESYMHTPASNPFDKGAVVGGYYYQVFEKEPKQNKLRVFSIADLEKRKPKYASAEFWGGTKSEYIDGKRTEVQTDGWREEMLYKTLCRACWNDVTLDSSKIAAPEIIEGMINEDSFDKNPTTIDTTAEVVRSEKANAEPAELSPAQPQMEINLDTPAADPVQAEPASTEEAKNKKAKPF